MSNYTIKPIKLGTIKRPVSNMLYNADTLDDFDFPLIAYYLESEDHKIIVDTGGSAPHPDRWQPYTRNIDEEIDNALEKIGVKTDEIDMVIFTHLHWDHAGNNAYFKNARFLAQKIEVECYYGKDEVKGYEVELLRETDIETIDGDIEIVPGISTVLVPGHSVGSQALIVDTSEGKYILSGDLVPRFENWRSDPKIPNGAFDSLETILASYAKLAALGIDRILPGHEPLVFEHLQYPHD